MIENLYLYQKPFVVTDNISHRDTYLFEYLSDTERADEKTIYVILLNFAVDHNLVTVNDGKMTGSTSQNMGSWQWVINWSNFRSLTEINQFYLVINSLSSDNQFPLTQVIDLHVRLGSLFHPKLLNTLANRVINAVKLIPHDLKDNDSISWNDIHTQAPFMWLIILLQIVIKSNTSKLT